MVFGFLKKLRGEDNDIIKQPPVASASAPANEGVSSDGSGYIVVEDVFSITGRGTVITGRIESGSFHLGQNIIIDTSNGQLQSRIDGIEQFRKTLDYAQAGENVGLLLHDIKRNQIGRGDKIIGE